MTPRLMQAALLLVLTACGSSPSATAQGGGSGARPFTVPGKNAGGGNDGVLVLTSP